MNGIRKKIMCLMLALCFLVVSSQAQGSYLRDVTTAVKGIVMSFEEWRVFGGVGIIENLEDFSQGKIYADNMLYAMKRNIAIALGFDLARGINTIKIELFDNFRMKEITTIRPEKAAEGLSYIAKGCINFNYHNQVIGCVKFLTLLYEDYFSKRTFYHTATVQDAEEAVGKTFKFFESLFESSNLYSDNRRIFYICKGLNKLGEGIAKFLVKILGKDTDLSEFTTANILGGIVARDVLILKKILPLLPAALEVIGPASFIILFQARSVYQLTRDFNIDNYTPSINFRRNSTALKCFEAGASNFKKATELKDKNIEKLLFLYSQAIKCYKTCISLLEDTKILDDTEKKTKSLSYYNIRECSRVIKNLIKITTIKVPVPDDESSCQTLRNKYRNCYKKILNAKDEAEIREALINLKPCEAVSNDYNISLEELGLL
jgi:hypothetical protein